jgi:hypothetical protein
VKKEEKAQHIPLAYRAEAAFKEAVAEALAEHRLHGIPIAIWREGKVVRIPPEEIVVRDFQVTYGKPRKMR